MDLLINDPELSRAYLVRNADDVDEAIAAVIEAEPRYYQSAQGLKLYATDVDEFPEALERQDFPLGEPHELDLAG